MFSAALVSQETAYRMTEHFSNVLVGVATAPQAQISALPLMGAEERKLTIETFNATDAPVRVATVHGLFEASAAAQPQASCIISAAGKLSYAQVRPCCTCRLMESTCALNTPVPVYFVLLPTADVPKSSVLVMCRSMSVPTSLRII